jgi:hypothetical protein
MNNSRRSPDDWHAIGQFWTQMAFAMCLVGATFGVIYCLIFVTQPMVGQAKNDAVLFEILKTVLTSMISIIGTLMAVGHGSNASSPPSSLPQAPLPPVGVTVSTPTGNTFVRPMSSAPSWTGRQPNPPSGQPKPMARPLATEDDDPPFKGAKE